MSPFIIRVKCQIHGLLYNKDIDKVLLHFKHILRVFITFRRYCFGIFLKIWHAV